METIIYKGIVRESTRGENDDALFIGDNSQPIAEIFEEDFEGKQVTVRYWISDKEKTKQELIKSCLYNLLGVVNAQYRDSYSEITGYLWTDENLYIGGHDLLEEIRNHKDEFIYLEVDVHDSV